jgi:hypothetical protein
LALDRQRPLIISGYFAIPKAVLVMDFTIPDPVINQTARHSDLLHQYALDRPGYLLEGGRTAPEKAVDPHAGGRRQRSIGDLSKVFAGYDGAKPGWR